MELFNFSKGPQIAYNGSGASSGGGGGGGSKPNRPVFNKPQTPLPPLPDSGPSKKPQGTTPVKSPAKDAAKGSNTAPAPSSPVNTDSDGGGSAPVSAPETVGPEDGVGGGSGGGGRDGGEAGRVSASNLQEDSDRLRTKASGTEQYRRGDANRAGVNAAAVRRMRNGNKRAASAGLITRKQ